jgi:hypothetical protein
LAERFYFDLTDSSTTIRDETGVVAFDLNDALRQAAEVMAEMQNDDEHEADAHKWIIVVRDSAGKAVTTMPLVPPDAETAKAS